MLLLKLCSVLAILSQILKVKYTYDSTASKMLKLNESQKYNIQKNISLVSTISYITASIVIVWGLFFEQTIFIAIFLILNGIIMSKAEKILKNPMIYIICSFIYEISLFTYIIFL